MEQVSAPERKAVLTEPSFALEEGFEVGLQEFDDRGIKNQIVPASCTDALRSHALDVDAGLLHRDYGLLHHG